MNKTLFQKYLKQQTTMKENQRVMEWFVDPHHEDEVLALLKSGWEDSSTQKNDGSFDKSATLDRIKSKIFKPVSTCENKKSLGWSWVMKIAAIFVLTIGLGIIIYSSGLTSLDTIGKVEWVEKVTSKGQKANIMLSDGSKVTMNADSRIRYLENYGEKIREVILEGEAFFDVVKDSDRPFKVRTANSITTALGTSFNIAAYPNELTSTISLALGKVEVIKTNCKIGEPDAVFLEKGEEAIVGGIKSVIVKQNFTLEKVLSWKRGVLSFDNTNIEETFNLLERWYDVSFDVHSHQDLNHLKGTGEFENQKLENVLRVLSYTMNFEYDIHGKQVKINFN